MRVGKNGRSATAGEGGCVETPCGGRVVDLLGLRLQALTETECVEHVISKCVAGTGGWVVTPNLDHLRRYRRDPRFRELIAGADLIVADGMPLVWASRLQGTPLPQRVAGSNLISSLTNRAAETGLSVYLLGGAPGTADGAAGILRHRHPDLEIAGTHCPHYGFERDPDALRFISRELLRSKPHIIYVALGSPKQEWLVSELKDALPCSWWIGVGISFSFLCGTVSRAPPWMQRTGLEWLHRLVQEPRRLAGRYLVTGLPFAARLLATAPLRRFRRCSGS